MCRSPKLAKHKMAKNYLAASGRANAQAIIALLEFLYCIHPH